MEPNELNEKPKFNWKRLLITVGIVIVTAGAIGGSVYYVMNQQAQKDKESAEKTAQDLQKQIDDLKKTETATSTTTTPTTTTTTDPTASWQTYTNTDHKFTLKVPTGWTAKTLTGGVRLSSGNQYFDVISFVNSGSYTPTTWLNEEIKNGNIASGSIANKTTKTFGTYPTITFQYNAMAGTSYWYVLGNSSQMVEVYTSNDPQASTKTTAEQVIPTLTLN